MERIAGRISYGNATPRDLVTLRQSLEAVPEIRRILDAVYSGGEPAAIARALRDCAPLPETAALIAKAIADDPPPNVRSGGVIRQGYDRSLDDLRQLATSGRDWIAAFQAEEREKTGIRSLKVGYTSVFGYYIEVTKPNIGAVPAHYERKQTTSTGERYTTRELREKEAQIATADERLLALECELYTALLTDLRAQVPALQQISRGIAMLDVAASLAEVAQRNGYSRPTVDASSQLLIREGRHPVVEQRMAGRFVPNDTMLDAGGDQILVITGANMAGKSTYMRAVGLTAIMAQTGSFVPAGHARLGLVDRIFTRVGAFDDLASGQSTFMVEMLELAQILNAATAKSLVILDEIGRGTSTLDGYAIARAVLEHLHGKGSNGPRTLFATHFHELIALEADLRRMKNYHFAVKDTGSEVIFLRKLIPGATDRSYGVHVARLAGVPRRVTDRANAILAGAIQAQGEGGGKVRAYTQMLLIDAPPSPGDDLLREIRALELDAMTPIEALSALYDLQMRARGGK
jgi:DNA mismatch repair protein MutS